MKNPPTQLIIETSAELPDTGAATVAVCVFTEDSSLSSLNDEINAVVERLMREGEFKGEEDTSLDFRLHNGQGVHRRLLLMGCGEHGDDDPPALSRVAGAAARLAREGRAKHLHLILPACHDKSVMARAVAEGAVMGLYEGDFYQSDDADKMPLEHLTIIVPDLSDELNAEVERGRIIAEAANWTRLLADTPGRDLPPTVFAQKAAEMAEEFGLTVESLNADEIKARGMGGLFGVGKGSDEPPALIVIRYEPEGASASDDLWAFVGKGITFDTGGISIKHGLDMYEMKTDMAGGAAVLGALRAIAQLKPAQRVVGIVPSAENMPSGRAIKPGDIVKTLAGYTIEVVDTDAEGRLVLVDGITYAKQLGATRIVDLATLTGSIIVALGDHRTGLFSNDDAWAGQVGRAAARAGEPVWRMPVSDDYKKRIESDIADFKNYGGRPDATSAALLLSKFAADMPWVHLDIAATSWYDDPQPHAPQGSSGTGVRTLVELVCHKNDAHSSGGEI